MPLIETIAGVATALTVVTGIVANRTKSVPANQYMAKTGLFVKGVHVSRITFQLPFQQIRIINLEPMTLRFIGHNMSKELIPFELPLTFTIRPAHPENDKEGFIRYATTMSDMSHNTVRDTIEGIVNGETRAFVGSMTVHEIFSDRDAFRERVVNRVQKDLEQFGLIIDNANVEDLKDFEGNRYFENLKQKALEAASNETKIAVAEARKHGNIGEKEREVDTRKQNSILEADAFQVETTNSQRISDYNRLINITATNNARELEMAKIAAHQETETNRIIVETNLNIAKQTQELEHLRSKNIIIATAETESTIKFAEAEATAIRIRADANLYTKMREAEGIQAALEASAAGLQRISDVSAGNPELAFFHMALEHGVFDKDGFFTKMAEKQAHAIKDMNPKINIWNTGSNTDDYTKVFTNLAKTIPPIFDVIQDQTQIKMPDFLSKMATPEMSSMKQSDIKALVEKFSDTKL